MEIEAEWATAELGDPRRTRRVQAVAARWAAKPGASFPKMVHTEGELAGLYGLMESRHVDPSELFAAHARASLERIDAVALGQTVLVVEDTTTFEFGGESVRTDVGWVSRSKQGFFAHIALALSADGKAQPFGVVGISTINRERPPPLNKQEKAKHDGKASASDPNRESLRWGRLVDETSELLRGHAIPIHISDRESDSYEYLSGRVAKQQRFVARARELNRPVTVSADGSATKSKLRLVAEASVPVMQREAKLSRRATSPLPVTRKRYPPRAERIAQLEFGAERVRIKRPSHLSSELLPLIELNLVHVREVNPPTDVEPVEWLLLTSESIDTAEDVTRVVDFYRARWTIEELNKAIKTGCQYESRQLEDLQALMIALAICIPIAWQMLALRQQSRMTPDAPASTVLSEPRLEALRTIARKPLPTHPTVLDALLAIAALGGHIARNGPPGWQTLRHGLDTLLTVEAAFAARDAQMRPRPPRSGQ